MRAQVQDLSGAPSERRLYVAGVCSGVDADDVNLLTRSPRDAADDSPPIAASDDEDELGQLSRGNHDVTISRQIFFSQR